MHKMTIEEAASLLAEAEITAIFRRYDSLWLYFEGSSDQTTVRLGLGGSLENLNDRVVAVGCKVDCSYLPGLIADFHLVEVRRADGGYYTHFTQTLPPQPEDFDEEALQLLDAPMSRA